MKFDVITLFPGTFVSPLSESMLKRAIQAGYISVDVHDVRDFAQGKHKQADDRPYGGGSGMVLMPEPLAACLKSVFASDGMDRGRVLLLSPQGRRLDHDTVRRLSGYRRLVLICGHYEGIDERITNLYVDEELSIGDYVLTGGELAALVVIDAVARQVPGVLGDRGSLEEESFSEELLEYPQYTRPEIFEGMKVPDVLLSGHHDNIRRWRRKERLRRTALRRPDLLRGRTLDREDRELLEAALKENEG